MDETKINKKSELIHCLHLHCNLQCLLSGATEL